MYGAQPARPFTEHSWVHPSFIKTSGFEFRVAKLYQQAPLPMAAIPFISQCFSSWTPCSFSWTFPISKQMILPTFWLLRFLSPCILMIMFFNLSRPFIYCAHTPEQWFSKFSLTITGELVRTKILRPRIDLLNQEMWGEAQRFLFNKLFMWFWYLLKFDFTVTKKCNTFIIQFQECHTLNSI